MRIVVADQSFTDFVTAYEPKLRVSLSAMYGPERGRKAAAEALAYAWEHWDRIRTMERPIGYLFRVGQSKTRRRRFAPAFETSDGGHPPWVEPGLPDALRRLSSRQRVAVVLVHAYDWTNAEAAEVLGVRTPTVKKHVQRGLAKLRDALGVTIDE
jgi:RNA polymerase sigma-70 factor (ECF subfamily)